MENQTTFITKEDDEKTDMLAELMPEDRKALLKRWNACKSRKKTFKTILLQYLQKQRRLDLMLK